MTSTALFIVSPQNNETIIYDATNSKDNQEEIFYFKKNYNKAKEIQLLNLDNMFVEVSDPKGIINNDNSLVINTKSQFIIDKSTGNYCCSVPYFERLLRHYRIIFNNRKYINKLHLHYDLTTTEELLDKLSKSTIKQKIIFFNDLNKILNF
jgi:hypothetical protein